MSSYSADVHDFLVLPSVRRNRAFDASWRVDVTGGPVFVPRFQLLISETEAGPWYRVFKDPIPENSVVGIGHEIWTNTPGRFLKLQVIDPGNNVCNETAAMSPTPEMSRVEFLEYRDHLRRENLALEKFTGTPGFLARRIISSCPCPQCSDEILGGAPDSSCPSCLGTGILKGYHPVVPMRADWTTTPKGIGSRKQAGSGISEIQVKGVKILPFPSAANEDIFIDSATRLRYIIKNVQPVVFKVWPVAQVLTLSLLPKKDPAYKIPLR